MARRLTCFLFLLSLIFLVSCGSDDDDSGVTNTGGNPPQSEEIPAQNFSTRLSPNLLVAGTRCEGGETTEYNDTTYTCERDQWLVNLDNVNTCTQEGLCTEIAVPNIIANLRVTDVISAPEFVYRVISPVSPVNARQRQVINSVYVRTDLNGGTEAVER